MDSMSLGEDGHEVEGVSPHKGWYSRGYLPHIDQPGLIQAITFRLADSLPRAKQDELKARDEAPDAARARLQAALDRGLGSCVLRDARAASAVEELLLYHDGEHYHLLARVVMPNHVHVLAETIHGVPLPRIVRQWKTYTARIINAIYGRSGPLWQSDYYDRFIRDQRHLGRATLYIHANPVIAGLVDDPAMWPHSSARFVEALEATYHVPYEQSDGSEADCDSV
jgi:REP element-mobilizing transposase RayT